MEWLKRFVAIMDVISEATADGVSITELASTTELSKGTLHRILQDMVGHNLISQNSSTKKYCLGPKAMVWGSKFVLGQDPAGILSQYCDLLAERTNLYTFLSRINEGEVYCIYTKQPSKFNKKYFVHVGQRMPLHCTAAAKSMVAFLPAVQIDDLITHNNMIKFTEHTKIEASNIIKELQDIKTTGIAFCREELELGVSGISTPIFVGNEQAAFSISLLSDAGFINQQEESLIQEIVKIGKQASEHMGRVCLLTSIKTGEC
ncbi:MAG: IclR family transcriptional regulator [Firmicutes bacterium]|nr:IclR family transcriptional regulator [Bacillota bacterium]